MAADWALRRPPSNNVSTPCGPIDQKRLGASIQLASEKLSVPAVPAKLKTGKKAARVTPIRALAAATRSSAAATSGLRSSSCDGRPKLIGGGAKVGGRGSGG